MPYQDDICIVLPLYKPKTDWHKQLVNNMEAAKAAFPAGLSIRFMVVNDGLETPALLDLFELIQEEFPQVTIVSYPENRGKGYALRTGVAASDARYTIVTDFDFPYYNDNLAGMYHSLQEGYDVVMGKRDETYYRSLPFKRLLISRACSLMNRVLLRLPVSDTQSGLKAFNHHGKRAFLSTTIDRFLIDTEFLQIAALSHMSIKVNTVQLREGITFSNMGMGVLKTELKNFVSIMRMRKQVRRPLRRIRTERAFGLQRQRSVA